MNERMNAEDMRKMETMKRMLLRKMLSKPAMERLLRIRMVRPEVADQLEMYLVNLYQSGKIKTEVSEEQMKMILETIAAPVERDFRIVRK